MPPHPCGTGRFLLRCMFMHRSSAPAARGARHCAFSCTSAAASSSTAALLVHAQSIPQTHFQRRGVTCSSVTLAAHAQALPRAVRRQRFSLSCAGYPADAFPAARRYVQFSDTCHTCTSAAASSSAAALLAHAQAIPSLRPRRSPDPPGPEGREPTRIGPAPGRPKSARAYSA